MIIQSDLKLLLRITCSCKLVLTQLACVLHLCAQSLNFLDMLTQSRLGLLVRILRARKRVDDLPRRTVHFHA